MYPKLTQNKFNRSLPLEQVDAAIAKYDEQMNARDAELVDVASARSC